MASGGARARSGPAPDPNALRRDRDGDGWKTLPAKGRQGKAPKWPLSKPTTRETTLWRAEWKRPQAIEWDRNGQEIEVALYVRALVAAEKRDAPTNARTLVRQFQEGLGLSVPGLARNNWKIEEAPDGSAKPSAARVPASGRARERFTVIDGDGGG